jgi:predicted nicotinamide N-methyase
MKILDRETFIRSNTTILPVPLVPEIKLHLAHEAVPLWQKTEEELGEIGLPPPFWAFAWAGGQALARYVLDNPETVRTRIVLDLASGSGLVGIAALQAGAKAVVAADIDEYAITSIKLNAQINQPSPASSAGEGKRDGTLSITAENLLEAPPPKIDTILVGDLFYEKHLAEKVFAWLTTAQTNGTQVFIGDPGRSYLPKDKLIKRAEYNVPVTRDLEDAEIKRTAVWTLANY